MKTFRFCLAAAVLSAVVAACGGGNPTAPARHPDRPSAEAGDSTSGSGATTSDVPPPPLPTNPPPDPRQIYGSGT